MADFDESNNYGIDDLVSQALGAVHAGADPAKVNQLFYQEAARRGADISKLSLNLENDNPNTNGAQKAPKVDSTTKADYRDAVVPETVQDLNRFDYSPNQARGDALSLEPTRDVGFVEAATKALNKTQATAATAMAPISYLGAAGSALVSGDDVPSYKEFLNTIGDVKEDSAPKEGENYGVAGNLGVLGGTLTGELGQFLGVTKAGAATEELPQLVSAGKQFLQKLTTNVAGGATPAVGEAATAYKEAKDDGSTDLEALAKAGKAGLEKEAMFVAPASLEGRLATRVASGAAAGTALGASQELADTGTLTPRELLTSAGTGAVFGALGEGPVEKPAFRGELPKIDDPAIKAGMKAVDKATPDKLPDIDDALGEEFTKAREEAWGGKLDEDTQPTKTPEAAKEPEAPPQSIDDLMKSAEKKKDVLDSLHEQVDTGNAYGAGTDNSGQIPAAVDAIDAIRGGKVVSIQDRLNSLEDKESQQLIDDNHSHMLQSQIRQGNPKLDELVRKASAIQKFDGEDGGVGQSYWAVKGINKAVDSLLSASTTDDKYQAWSNLNRMHERWNDVLDQGLKERGITANPPAKLSSVENVAPKGWGNVEGGANKPGEIGSWQFNLDTGRRERVYTTADTAFSIARVNTPADVMKAYHAGNLTTGKLFDSFANDKTGRVEPEQKQLAGYLKEASDRLGGGDVAIGRYNGDDITHASEKDPGRMADSGGAVAGYYDKLSNQIRLAKDAPNQNLLIHEATHALTSRAVFRGMQGQLDDSAQRAFNTLSGLFDGLKTHLTNTKQLTEVQNREGKMVPSHYGFTNIDEYLSEFFSNPQFRSFLKDQKLDDVTPATAGGIGRAFLGRVRNMYDATVKGIRHILGLPEKAENMLDATFAASHNFISKIKPEDLHDLRGMKRTPDGMMIQDRSNNSGQLPPSSRRNAESQEPPEKPKSFAGKLLDEARQSDIGMLAREALTSDRLSKEVTDAQRTRQSRMALGEIEAIQSANRLKSITTPENRESVGRALVGDQRAFRSLDPKAQDVVREEYKQNVQRSIDIAKEILNVPNRTPLQENIARKILNDAGKYQADAYAAKLFPKRMKEKYASAEAGAKTTAPTAQQQRDMQDLKDARSYVENYWMPHEDSVDGLKADHRDDVYKYLTGVDPDKKFSGLEREDRKVAENAAIKDGLRKITNRSGATEDILKQAMGLTRLQKNSMRQYYNNMRNPSDVFSTRGDIPAQLKKLWEPITDPIARNVASIQRQYSYLSNLRAQNQLREEGLKNGIFTEAKGDATRKEQITGDKMGPLQGLHAAPDVKRALDSIFQTNQLTGDLLDSFISDSRGQASMMNLAASVLKPAFKYTGIQKALQVIGNGANWVLNAVGSPAQLMATGTLAHPIHTAKGMLDTAKLIGATFRKNLPEDLKDAYKYGIVEYSQIQELHSGGNRKLIEQLLQDAAKQANPLTAFLHSASKQGLNTVREAYGAMDFYTKMANWNKELDLWKGINQRHNLFKNDEELKQFVSRRVNATNITPSHAPKAVRGLESTGVTQFATYYAEILRTLKNNGLQAIHDSYLAVKLGDARLLTDSLLRGAGTTAAAGWHSKFFGAIAGGAAALMGLNASDLPDDDARRKYMNKDNFLSSVDPMILTDPKHPEAGEYMFDKTRPDPYAPSTIFLTTGLSGLNKMVHGDKKGAMQDLSNSWNQMLSLRQSNTLWRTVGKVWSADAPRLKNENPALYDYVSSKLTPYMTSKNADRMMDFMEMPIPGTVKNILYSQELNKKMGLDSDVKSPALSATKAAGFTSKFDVKENISNFIAGKAKDDITKAKNHYADLLKQNYETDPKRLESGFRDTLKEASDSYETLRLAVQAAKAQGTDNSDLTKRLQAAGVSRQMASALRRDLPMKDSFVKAELDRDMKADIIDAEKDPDKRRAARVRFRKNSAAIRHLIGEYKHTDIEELQ